MQTRSPRLIRGSRPPAPPLPWVSGGRPGCFLERDPVDGPGPGPPAICPVGKGVTVIVDFGSTTTKSCAPGDPTSRT